MGVKSDALPPFTNSQEDQRCICNLDNRTCPPSAPKIEVINLWNQGRQLLDGILLKFSIGSLQMDANKPSPVGDNVLSFCFAYSGSEIWLAAQWLSSPI